MSKLPILLKKTAKHILPKYVIHLIRASKRYFSNIPAESPQISQSQGVPSPDFYLLCGRGSRTNSLIYYLNLMGFPTTSPIRGEYKTGRHINSLYPHPKSKYSFGYGITLDRTLLKDKPLSYGTRGQNVIQLIRDPIDALVAWINWHVACAIFPHPNYAVELSVFNDVMIPKFVDEWVDWICKFTSLRASIDTRTKETFFVDHKDLAPDFCLATLGYIHASLSSLPFIPSEELKQSCQIDFDNIENLTWHYQPFKGVGQNLIFPAITQISVIPLPLHDFFRNTWEEAHCLDIVEYNNLNYMISVPKNYFLDSFNSREKKLWNRKHREALKEVLEIHLAHRNLSMDLYNEIHYTPERLIKILKARPHTHKKFMDVMDAEIRLPLKIVPHKIERWKNFHKLY
ncbi:hypothetical protein [uncultured Desulfovibrio sp.]|uniref:hypothetical protein n=1 Tax=uncultured Desulfovibrio sp. TaxID=167968 RepID=UPI0025EEB90B|nr:hypothetical protein [uncultured Desulfovibrio sp.]